MQKISDKTVQLMESIETRNRQLGRTTAIARAALAVKNGVVVTHDIYSANKIRKHHGVPAYSISQIDQLIGTDVVIFYDHTVVPLLANDLSNLRESINNKDNEREKKNIAFGNEPSSNVAASKSFNSLNNVSTTFSSQNCTNFVIEDICKCIEVAQILPEEDNKKLRSAFKTYKEYYFNTYPDRTFIMTKSCDGHINFMANETVTWSYNVFVPTYVDSISLDYSTPKENQISQTIKESETKDFNPLAEGIEKLNKLFDLPKMTVTQSTKINDNQIIIDLPVKVGSYCQKCNTYNEYIEDKNYLCYSCKH